MRKTRFFLPPHLWGMFLATKYASGISTKFKMASGGKVDISQLRNLVRRYIDSHLYKTALFWADKAVSLSNGDIQDVYWFAQTLFLTGQFHRAAHALKSRGVIQTTLACRYLAAKCHAELRQWQEALDILEMEQKELGDKDLPTETCFVGGTKRLESAVSLLKGMMYEAMNNRSLAIDCYKDALKSDVHCFEAFDLLISHHMLTEKEERELLISLPFSEQCMPEEVDLIKFLYDSKTKKYSKPIDPKLPSGLETLHDNLDIVAGMAERHFYNCNYSDSYKMTSAVLSSDLYHEAALPIHITCLVELKKTNELFFLGHKLVDNYPQKAVAWYAVGCYYLVIEKYEQARRYFSKATTLEQVYGPAWLAFGHAFAAEGEHDQAMAAYFTASKLMPRCHLPLLYIGLEYGKTNNAKLAERFLDQALVLSPDDPYVKQEMGVIAFQNGDNILAERYFKEALQKAEISRGEVLSETWETLLNNLGHACRKLGRYQEAIRYHKQALVLVPKKASTFSALGFVNSLLGNHHEAIGYFHKALGIQREDTFSVHMLGQTLEQLTLEANAQEKEANNLSIEMDERTDDESD